MLWTDRRGEKLNQMIDDGKSQTSVDAAQGESASQFGLVERRARGQAHHAAKVCSRL